MTATFIAVIPARMASTRLPGKPLADIAGKPMVIRVAERAHESGAARVIIATDDMRVMATAKEHGVDACLTRADHATGTDRLAEVVEKLDFADSGIVINVQGDEPLIDARLIRLVATTLANSSTASIATAAHPIIDAAEFFNPNVVKVVLDAEGFAHYFSRAPIPYARDAFAVNRNSLPADFPALRHVGLYAYRAKFLRRYAGLSVAPTERFEALEQLRALYHGYRIAVAIWSDTLPTGVDTADDLAKVRALYK